MKKYFFILLSIAANAATTDDARDYAYAWPLAADTGGAAYQVELTPDVYAALTTLDLRDLDVINAAGDSVPVALYRPVTAAPRNPSVRVPMFTVAASANDASSAAVDDAIHLHIERGPDGRLSSLDAATTPPRPGVAQNETVASNAAPRFDNRSKIILDASSVHAALLSLTIDWDRHTDATAHFAIGASDDLQTWHTLVANAAATRLTQNANTLERHEIPLDRAPHAYLMLTRTDNGPALPDLTVSVTTPAGAQQVEQRWLTATSDGVDATVQGATVFVYHLPAAVAANGINVQLADDNAVARGQLSYTPLVEPKQSVGAGSFVAFRLRDGDALLTNDPLRNVISSRAREWRIAFATPMAHAPALDVGYTPERIVFLAQGPAPYRLLAGSAAARRADAPVEVALAQLRSSNGAEWQPARATLGTRVDAAGASALLVKAAPSESPWKKIVLWGVLVIAAAVVGGLALSLLRKS